MRRSIKAPQPHKKMENSSTAKSDLIFASHILVINQFRNKKFLKQHVPWLDCQPYCVSVLQTCEIGRSEARLEQPR